MFENVDRRTDGRTTDAGVTGILIAHLGAFGSGELKIKSYFLINKIGRLTFSLLVATFVVLCTNSLESDQDLKNTCPHLDPNCFIL